MARRLGQAVLIVYLCLGITILFVDVYTGGVSFKGVSIARVTCTLIAVLVAVAASVLLGGRAWGYLKAPVVGARARTTDRNAFLTLAALWATVAGMQWFVL